VDWLQGCSFQLPQLLPWHGPERSLVIYRSRHISRKKERGAVTSCSKAQITFVFIFGNVWHAIVIVLYETDPLLCVEKKYQQNQSQMKGDCVYYVSLEKLYCCKQAGADLKHQLMIATVRTTIMETPTELPRDNLVYYQHDNLVTVYHTSYNARTKLLWSTAGCLMQLSGLEWKPLCQ
jgi:hypothetical protein